jgi:putative transposase
LLFAFGRRQREAIKRYRQFIAAGRDRPSPWEELRNQNRLGSETFVNALQARLLPERDLSEIPAGQQRPFPRPFACYQQQYRDRDLAIVQAYASGGYSLKEIGEHLGLRDSQMSRIVRRTREARGNT